MKIEGKAKKKERKALGKKSTRIHTFIFPSIFSWQNTKYKKNIIKIKKKSFYFPLFMTRSHSCKI